MLRGTGAAQGLDIGETSVVVEVRPCQGLARGPDGAIEKRFAKKAEPYPLQARPCCAP